MEAGVPEQIETDTDKVRQVLKNFLANAVKFAERGEVLLMEAFGGGFTWGSVWVKWAYDPR